MLGASYLRIIPAWVGIVVLIRIKSVEVLTCKDVRGTESCRAVLVSAHIDVFRDVDSTVPLHQKALGLNTAGFNNTDSSTAISVVDEVVL